MAFDPAPGPAGRAPLASQSAQPIGGLDELFLSSLPEIDAAIAFVARRHRLGRADAEDFGSEARLALIENGYSALARFQGRSSLRTYLITVIHRLFLDHRRKLWGKWRPSAEAERLGPVAVRLELLLYRDGLSMGEAVETLRLNQGVEESPDALRRLAASLPVRTMRRSVPDAEQALAGIPSADSASPHAELEGAALARRAQESLTGALEALPAADRIALRLRFEDGLSVATIAKVLGQDQKALYRRFEHLLTKLRASLEGRGLLWSDVQPMVEGGRCHLTLSIGAAPEIGPASPSNQGEKA